MMNAADRTLPSATSQIVARCIRRGSRRSAEDVADQPRVRRPVHPELEFLDQAGDHADRDIDDQQDAEEPGQPQVLIPLAAIPGRLQQRGQESQADRDRHEKEMIDGHKRELPPRKIDVRHLLPRSGSA
jgi:hypothetical protein